MTSVLILKRLKFFCFSCFSKFSILSFLVLFIIGFSFVILAQNPPLETLQKSPIIVDGRVLFKVGSLPNFSTEQRAEIINKTLAQEVRSPEPIDLSST
ncbi:MAG: hypothetical protein MK105_17625 [Crocinitomicaceae bacterium]|nr:hypothetical protein [Crocinitomicaceae bacterium]